MKALVVFFSRTGHTRQLAEEIGHASGWDVEELVDTRPRAGVLGYLRSAIDGALGRLTVLREPSAHPADYDLVVVGTPVWNASLSSPVRTWLAERRNGLPQVAFFATEGGSGAERVFRQMASVAGREPIGTYCATDRELARDGAQAHARRFVEALRADLARLAPSPPEVPPPGPMPT